MSYRFWEALTVLLTSSTKFLPSPFLSINVYDFGFWETVLITTVGGIGGIFFFYGISGYLMRKAWEKRMQRIAEGREPKKKNFRRRNKIIIQVKRKFGLIGLAIITPAIISIPIGCILAAKYFRTRKGTLPYLIVSTFLWSLLLSGVAQLFGSPFHAH